MVPVAMRWVVIILLLTACQPEPMPELDCYHCRSPIMPSWTVCGATEQDIEHLIRWRSENLGDTLICEIIECE